MGRKNRIAKQDEMYEIEDVGSVTPFTLGLLLYLESEEENPEALLEEHGLSIEMLNGMDEKERQEVLQLLDIDPEELDEELCRRVCRMMREMDARYNPENKQAEQTEEKQMDKNQSGKMYITITGMNFYYGQEWLEAGMQVKLVKDPDNEHDPEAIKVEAEALGKVGYVANSPRTVLGECMSGGRLYDKIGDEVWAVVKYVLPQGVVCEVKGEEEKEDIGKKE